MAIFRLLKGRLQIISEFSATSKRVRRVRGTHLGLHQIPAEQLSSVRSRVCRVDQTGAVPAGRAAHTGVLPGAAG